MSRIQANPLAVVAAATAGGMLVGRLMRSRNHYRDAGFLRGASSHQFQSYQAPMSYQPYRGNPAYQGYPMPGGFERGPQYRAEQEFQQGSRFRGSHENFTGGSNWS
jgi:hypothetical protein